MARQAEREAQQRREEKALREQMLAQLAEQDRLDQLSAAARRTKCVFMQYLRLSCWQLAEQSKSQHATLNVKRAHMNTQRRIWHQPKSTCCTPSAMSMYLQHVHRVAL